MADRIRIHTGRLGSDAQRILSLLQKIQKEMDAMKQKAAALEHMWEGPGQEEFQKAWRNDMESVMAAVREAEGIYGYDVNAKKQYEQCERKIAAMIEEMKV